MVKTITLMILFALAAAAADVATEWNLYYVKASAADPPHLQSRGLAILNLAMHDAINAVQPKYGAYRYRSTGFKGGSSEAAAANAGRVTLLALLPPTEGVSIGAIYDRLIATVPDGNGRTLGNQAGEAAAQMILHERAGDFAHIEGTFPALSRVDSYLTTPPINLPGGAFAGWGGATPFTMKSGDQFRAAAPPKPGGLVYAREYNEVAEIGSINSATRSPNQTQMALFWAEGGSPGGWVRIALTAADIRKLNLTDRTRMLAILTAGLADAYISMCNNKYFYYRWRPISAIRNGDLDGNAKTTRVDNWTPLLVTPPDPQYPSGHAIGAMAAAEILAHVLGSDYIELVATNAEPGIGGVRTISSFSLAAQESGDSRILGGIHFSSARNAGFAIGRLIGKQAATELLKPLE